MPYPDGNPEFHRVIAKNTTASLTTPTTPTAVTYTAASADPNFNLATGVITFDQDVLFTSVFNTSLSATSGSPFYYADAEVSTDGGTTWVRGVDSLRAEQIRSTDGVRTINLTFSGSFLKGQQLRFVHWASVNTVRQTSATISGSAYAAIRLTYTALHATIIS